MEVAKVSGSLWATKKDERLEGQKFLICENLVDHRQYAAADMVGAGTGDTVMVVRGEAARLAAGKKIPIDQAIVGIIDKIEVEKDEYQ